MLDLLGQMWYNNFNESEVVEREVSADASEF